MKSDEKQCSNNASTAAACLKTAVEQEPKQKESKQSSGGCFPILHFFLPVTETRCLEFFKRTETNYLKSVTAYVCLDHNTNTKRSPFQEL